MKTTQRKKRPYRVEMIVNGNKIRKQTDDIESVILEQKPEILFTEMYISVTRGKDISERKLTLIQGKKLFNNDDYREIFINNLLIA